MDPTWDLRATAVPVKQLRRLYVCGGLKFLGTARQVVVIIEPAGRHLSLSQWSMSRVFRCIYPYMGEEQPGLWVSGEVGSIVPLFHMHPSFPKNTEIHESTFFIRLPTSSKSWPFFFFFLFPPQNYKILPILFHQLKIINWNFVYTILNKTKSKAKIYSYGQPYNFYSLKLE